MIETVSRERLAQSIVTLLDESFQAPPEGPTWYTDRKGGLLDVLRGLSAEAASTPPGPGRATIAAHAEHVRFALNLATRFLLHGENAYPTANWKESWAVQSVDEAGWKGLLEALEEEYRALRGAVASGDVWLQVDEAFTGVLAHLVHVGYHLGAIRQMVRSLEGAGTP